MVLFFVAVLGLPVLLPADCTRVSVEEIEAKIAKDLPEGTEAKTIIRWLRENEIELRSRGPADRYVGPHMGPRDYEIVPGTTFIIAGIKNTGGDGLFITNSITIYFVLDGEDRLLDVLVDQDSIGL